MLYVWYPKNKTDLNTIHEENDVIETPEELARVNPISTGLFCLGVALGGGGVFHPPSITPLSLKLDCSNFVQSYV